MATPPSDHIGGQQPPDLDEGVWRRAWADASEISRLWRFRIPAGLVTVGFSVLGALLPSKAKPSWRVVCAVLGAGGGAIVVGMAAFFGVLLLAAVRQRNEARAYARQRLPWATPAELGSLYIQGRVLKITDLVIGGAAVLRNRTFDGCEIYGPAILIGDSPGIFAASRFDGTMESTFWAVEDGRHWFSGAIVLENCVFRNCRFVNVGLAGSAEMVARWRATGFQGQPPSGAEGAGP